MKYRQHRVRNENHGCRRIFAVFLVSLGSIDITQAFCLHQQPFKSDVTSRGRQSWRRTASTSRSWQFYYHNDEDENSDALDAKILELRLGEMRRKVLEDEYKRPPNPDLKPFEFVSELLWALSNNSDPLPDSGFRMLLRASTKEWRRKLYTAVAAPENAGEEIVASAVGEAMGRPRNQYGILVGEGEEYYASFPTDVLDYGDGKCWVECRLRDKKDDSLLAILGWELEQRQSDGAWLVSSIDWQDFREAYRPGIGREEWMRICG